MQPVGILRWFYVECVLSGEHFTWRDRLDYCLGLRVLGVFLIVVVLPAVLAAYVFDVQELRDNYPNWFEWRDVLEAMPKPALHASSFLFTFAVCFWLGRDVYLFPPMRHMRPAILALAVSVGHLLSGGSVLPLFVCWCGVWFVVMGGRGMVSPSFLPVRLSVPEGHRDAYTLGLALKADLERFLDEPVEGRVPELTERLWVDSVPPSSVDRRILRKLTSDFHAVQRKRAENVDEFASLVRKVAASTTPGPGCEERLRRLHVPYNSEMEFHTAVLNLRRVLGAYSHDMVP